MRHTPQSLPMRKSLAGWLRKWRAVTPMDASRWWRSWTVRNRSGALCMNTFRVSRSSKSWIGCMGTFTYGVTAHLFYEKKSQAASRFAKDTLLRLLRGEVEGVIRGLRWKGTHKKLSKKRRQELERICGYFENNRHRMAYHEYLEAGYPIAHPYRFLA
jgi:hypothetical protein